MVEHIKTDEVAKQVIALCEQGFSTNNPRYYDQIDELLSPLDQTPAVQRMRRFAQVGPTLSSKRFAYPHIEDAARDVLNAA